MENDFLIPANSKRSMLIFGLFRWEDLIIFGVGLVVSLILLLSLPIENMVWAIVAISPGLIAGFLVLPIPNYHNMRTLLTSAFTFFTSRQKYVWKGWCVLDDAERASEQQK